MATARNTNIVRSAQAPAAAVGDDCTHIGFWSDETAGDFLGSVQITTNPDPLQLDERMQIAAGALVLTQPTSTGETAKMAVRALNGRIGAALWISYHTSSPGTDGSAGLIPIARTGIVASAWTVAE